MEPIIILLIVMTGLAGMISLLLGYTIKHKQLIESISMPGFATGKIENRAAFSRFAGNRSYIIGCIALVTAVIITSMPQYLMIIILSHIFSIMISCIELIVGTKAYLLKHES